MNAGWPTIHRSRLVVLLVSGLSAWLFRDLLFHDELPAFRDAADFYYPLFHHVQELWSAGQLPLWNPYDNLGLPLAANPTASVWYPGKLVFFLPVAFDWAYRAYILGHALLAAWSAYRLARHWQCTAEAAGLCAMAYAFGGSVLFQYANVVYLVGAAWMPLALLAAEHLFAGSRAAVAGLGIALAMMILGGDPQAAYHALLLIGLRSLFRGSLAESVNKDGCQLNSSDPFFARVGLAVAVAALLAAIQVLPAWRFAALSDRAVTNGARSLWEIPQACAASQGRPIADGLLCRCDDPHLEHVYQFSLQPWRLLELVWPNCGGRQLPVHRRWSELFAPTGRVWVPSLYLGLLPIVLALWQVRLRRGPALDRWLSWAALLAAAASFGVYGLGWLINHLAVPTAASPPLGDPVGGIYWLLTVLLPGYVQFRYPAKWMTVASLLLCLLAARGWDRLHTAGQIGDDAHMQTRSPTRWLMRLSLASLLASAVVFAIRPWWPTWLAAVEPDPFFGPLDTAGAARDLVWALLHTALLAATLAGLLAWRSVRVRWAGPACLVLLAADLAVANGWMVATAEAKLWHTPSPIAAWIQSQQQSTTVPPRVYRHWLWSPHDWQQRGSTERLAEAVRWERATLAPQYHLAFAVAQAETYGSLMPADLRWLLRVAEEGVIETNPSGRSSGWGETSLAGMLGVDYAILPRPPDTISVPVDKKLRALGLDPVAADVRLQAVPSTMPRAWIVHRVQVVPPLPSAEAALLRRRSEEFLELLRPPETARRVAMVETDAAPPQTGDPGPAGPEENCRIVEYGPTRVVIEASLTRPGLVVLAEQFDPAWKLQIQAHGQEVRPAQVLRTNRVLRGAWLDAGRHRLMYEYRPASFSWGVAISGLAWLAVLAWGALNVVPVLARAGIRLPGRRGSAG